MRPAAPAVASTLALGAAPDPTSLVNDDGLSAPHPTTDQKEPRNGRAADASVTRDGPSPGASAGGCLARRGCSSMDGSGRPRIEGRRSPDGGTSRRAIEIPKEWPPPERLNS